MTGFIERFKGKGQQKRLQAGLEGLEGLEGGHEAAREQSLLQNKRETTLYTARKLIEKTRMDNASIAEVTGLPEAEIQTLRNKATQ